MFFLKTKSGVQSAGSWDQAKSEYEGAIQRCYKWKIVPLALCGFQKFSAFNFKYRDEDPREPYIESDLKFYGVVHERSKFERHVQCEVEILNAPTTDDAIGYLALTHTSSGAHEDKSRPEEKNLELEVSLRDPGSTLKTSLIEGLRDAALSGLRFMRIELVCAEPTSEELDKAITDMREKGYGPRRDILAVKMWPSIELENSPQWARRAD
jgi:hypothetical protein